MTDFFSELITQPFLIYAMLAGILASIGCGLAGTFVVVNRIGYLAGAIAHSALGGMGAAYYYGFDPVSGALVAAVLSALIVGMVRLRSGGRDDTSIGAIWAIGMAIGIIFISKTDGYNTNLMSFLFGNVLMVSSEQLQLMLFLDVLCLGVYLIFYKQLVAVSFDMEFANIRGVNVKFAYLLLLCLVSITVVLLIQVVGLILVIALLTLPAAIARYFVNTIGSIIVIAILLGSGFSFTGLYVAYTADWPAGATTVVITGICYFLIMTLGHWSRLLPDHS